MTVPPPRDPRTAPITLLQRYMPLPEQDAEAKAGRQMLHRIDLGEKVRK